jgi:hypothetical protein
MNRCAQCGGKFGLNKVRHWLDFLKARSATSRRVMNVQSRHWLDYDSVALVVLVVGMSAVALLALSI